MSTVDRFAQRFADDLATYHEAELKSADLELSDAFIVKIMALSALAYDLPIGDDTPFELEEVIGKLRAAMIVLKQAACSGG
jgi:hypothetical protein